MKKFLGIVLVTAFVFSGLQCAAFAAGGGSQKIGYFELKTILTASNWAKRSNEEFKRQEEKLMAELGEKDKAFKAARDDFEKKKDAMNESARNKKQRELADMQADGQKLLADANAKLGKLSNDLMTPIFEKVSEIVKKIGRDEKYDFIFERDKAGLLWTNERDDVTKRVISELDKVSPK